MAYDYSKIESIMGDIKKDPNTSTLTDLKNELNRCYNDSKCRGVIYTRNTDKVFFGMCVLPVISDQMAVDIISTDDPIRLKEYYLEIDSKLYSPLLNLTTEELTAIILHEVGHLVNDASPVDTLRRQVDIYLARNSDHIIITDSVYYRYILAFAFQDTIRKITSIFFDMDEIKADQYVVKCGYGEALESAMEKIEKQALSINKSVNDKFVILGWALRLYKNLKIRRIASLRTIRDAKKVSPSQLEKKELDALDDRLRKIDDASLIESTKIFTEFTKPSDKFRELKIKGLKGFEEDYYEYNMIKRNVTDQDEALWLMRQINTRISVIDNFLATEQLNDSETSRWNKLFERYCKLRDELSSKLVYKDRFIGVQVNYPAIKGLDY